jgi:putative transposase
MKEEKVSETFSSQRAGAKVPAMSRPLRVDVGGYVYHALNRASARATLFEEPDDYQSFEQVLYEAHLRTGMRILAYCLMPNHWHLVLWPRRNEASDCLGRSS